MNHDYASLVRVGLVLFTFACTYAAGYSNGGSDEHKRAAKAERDKNNPTSEIEL